MSDLMTTAQAAAFLKVSKSFLYQATRSGEIPAMKLGRCWRYSRESLESWISNKIGES